MRTRTTVIALIALSLAGTAPGALLAAGPSLPAADKTPEALIGHARAVVLAPHFSREDITGALAEVLDAALLILPATDYADDFKARIGTVRKMLAEGVLFSDKERQYLGFAYKMVNGGAAWQVPAELTAEARMEKSIDLARKICAGLLDSALAEHKAGRRELAVRDLLGFVILVVTPMEA